MGGGGFAAPLSLAETETPPAVILAGVAAALLGAGLALWLWGLQPAGWQRRRHGPPLRAQAACWEHGWGFDTLYHRLFVAPYSYLARVNRADAANRPYDLLVRANLALNRALLPTQNGRLRWYALAMGLGTALFLAWGLGS